MSNLLVTVHMEKEVLPMIRIVYLLVRLVLLMIIAIELRRASCDAHENRFHFN